MQKLFNTVSGEKWERIGIKKRAGILIPLFSIHSEHSTGIGDFFDLKLMAQLCNKSGCSILQILPLNFTGSDNCPYNAISSFAIDPVYISLKNFEYNGFQFSENIIKSFQKDFPAGKNYKCNYEIREKKISILNEIFKKYYDDICSDSKFFSFVKNNKYWLDDFSIFRVLKKIHGGSAWYDWENCFANRDTGKLTEISNLYEKDILFEKWIQFVCFNQLCSVKKYIETMGVLLMGDMPVLASRDSADVWSKREFFNLEFSAGAPPDMYCVYGQRWGMPVQNWDNVETNGFKYIKEKLKYLDNFFHMIRIDHVVGLFRIWAIPANEPEENHGMNGFFMPSDTSLWKKQGHQILSIMVTNTNCLLCAEDLGIIPPECTETLQELGICGYEVQRWKKHYGTDYSFIPSEQYRQLAISGLSTHDTSFWLFWFKHEAGTIEKELFFQKCKTIDIDGQKFVNLLFESVENERLKWKSSVDSEEKLIQIFDKPREKLLDIINIYRDTFDEKEKLKKSLGIEDYDNESVCIKKAINFVLRSVSIFSINLFCDLACLDSDISREIYNLRINKPGTTGNLNWTFAFQQPLEDLIERKFIDEIKEMVKNCGR